MPAGSVDFVIEQGATWQRTLTWLDDDGDPVNVTGMTAALQARLTKSATTPVLDLTTENGGISLGGAAGTITITMDATETAALSWVRPALYDLLIKNGPTAAVRLLQGKLRLNKSVTHV